CTRSQRRPALARSAGRPLRNPDRARARWRTASARIMTKRRALGQHFLRDPAIARAIVDLVAPTAQDLVVEIGPGDGALTGLLTGRAARVIALEIDQALGAALRARLPAVEVLDADARSWDYAGLAAPAGGRVLILGNLPYSVGKPILTALIAARAAID